MDRWFTLPKVGKNPEKCSEYMVKAMATRDVQTTSRYLQFNYIVPRLVLRHMLIEPPSCPYSKWQLSRNTWEPIDWPHVR